MNYNKDFSFDFLFPETIPAETQALTKLTIDQKSFDASNQRFYQPDATAYTQASYNPGTLTAITEADFLTLFSGKYAIYQYETYSLANYTYQIEDSNLSITLPTLFSNYSFCNQNIEYITKLTDGSALPNFISFDAASTSFSIQTDNFTNAGNYTIKVQFYSLNEPTVIDDMLEFTVWVNGTEVVSTVEIEDPSDVDQSFSPPTFSAPLESLTLEQKETITYSLPSITSTTGNQVDVAISLGDAKPFVNY